MRKCNVPRVLTLSLSYVHKLFNYKNKNVERKSGLGHSFFFSISLKYWFIRTSCVNRAKVKGFIFFQGKLKQQNETSPDIEYFTFACVLRTVEFYVCVFLSLYFKRHVFHILNGKRYTHVSYFTHLLYSLFAKVHFCSQCSWKSTTCVVGLWKLFHLFAIIEKLIAVSKKFEIPLYLEKKSCAFEHVISAREMKQDNSRERASGRPPWRRLLKQITLLINDASRATGEKVHAWNLPPSTASLSTFAC